MKDKKPREKYTRVTTVLYPFSGLDKLDPEVVKHAAERGTKVHKICEGIIQGLGEIGIEDETRPYVESFKKWWGEGHKVVLMEQRFYHETKQIQGQADLIIETAEGLAIVDLKTSSKESPTWIAQGNAYAMLAKNEGYDIKRILFVHLSRTGKEPRVIEYPVDDSFFIHILWVYNHFFRKD